MFEKLKLLFSPLTKEEKVLLKKINIDTFDIFMTVYFDYKRKIKNNKNESFKTSKNKLLRNIILGKKIKIEGQTEIYQYGNLTITYAPSINEVISIHNAKGMYYFDNSKEQLKRREWLNNYLGIEVWYRL